MRETSIYEQDENRRAAAERVKGEKKKRTELWRSRRKRFVRFVPWIIGIGFLIFFAYQLATLR